MHFSLPPGNKTLSGLGALLFLAIWHGFSPAYFFSFTIEFADVEAERILHKLLLPIFGWMYDRSDSKRHASAAAIIGRTVSSAVCFLLIWINVSYGTVAFDLLTWSRVKSFADSMFWMSHIGCAVVFLLTVLMPKRRHKVKEQ